MGIALAVIASGSSLAMAGGSTAPSGRTASGGTEFGVVELGPPSVKRFSVAPTRVTSGAQLPTIRVRLTRSGTPTIAARVILWPVRGAGGKLVRIPLGAVPAGRTITVAWPEGTVLTPGKYTVRVHVNGAKLARAAQSRVTLRVDAPPAPAPVQTQPVVIAGGVFPVAGAHTYPPGGEFANDRGTHLHQGTDISAAEGLPILAPVAGTVRIADYQASGAGYYFVLTAADGREMFFAHTRAGSAAVVSGDRVAQGAKIAEVGSSGRSTGPHLHFELWPDGWRTSDKVQPVDPKPQLLAWDPDS